MKTLIIYPGSKTNRDSVFYLMDPETGECLASHLCSNAGYAKGDLLTQRTERKQEIEKAYGEEVECKFIDETDYNWEEIYRLN